MMSYSQGRAILLFQKLQILQNMQKRVSNEKNDEISMKISINSTDFDRNFDDKISTIGCIY